MSVLDPITLPDTIPDAMKIDLPQNSNINSVAVVNLTEIKTLGLGSPFSLGSNFSDDSSISVSIGGLRSFFTDSAYAQAQMVIKSLNGGTLNLTLRTPPESLDIKIVPVDKSAFPVLNAPNRVLTEVQEVTIQNTSPSAIEVTVPGGITGTLHQQITNYFMGGRAPGCNSNTQGGSDASINETDSAFLFIKDEALPFDWVSRSQAANLIITLNPAEKKTLGFYVESATVQNFYLNGVSYGGGAYIAGAQNCQIWPPQDMNSGPECNCDDGTFRTGRWASQPTFSTDALSSNFKLRWADLPASVDPETRPIQWNPGSIGIF